MSIALKYGLIAMQQNNNTTKLEELILAAMPDYESPITKGSVNDRKLANDIGISRQTLHYMLKHGKIRGKYVNRICRVSNNKITPEELLPFIIFD